MAANLERQHRSSDDQIRNAFLWAYGRPANRGEREASTQFFREFKPSTPAEASSRSITAVERRREGGRRRQRDSTPESTEPETAHNQKLAIFCQTLMASARFRILN